MKKGRILCFSLAAISVLAVGAAWAQGKQGIFRAANPPWVLAGQTATVKLIGQDLTAKEIRFQDGRIAAKVVKVGPAAAKNDEEKKLGNTAVEAEVTVPADLRPGLYPFQFIPESGPPVDGKLLIDVNAPEVEEKEPNGSLKAPQSLPLGSVTVVGKLDGDGSDVFQVQGKAGETWRFEVFARRLNAATKLEAVLRLRDPRMAPVRTVVDQGQDCAIEYKLPVDGLYLIEVFDGDNKSAADLTYRLAVRQL